MSSPKPALSSSGRRSASPSSAVEETTALVEQASLNPVEPEAGALPSSEGDDRPVVPFNPFFTLIEDTTTSEHFHPTVHYIFSDDDTEVLTEVSLEALSLPASSHSNDLASSGADASTQPHPTPQRPGNRGSQLSQRDSQHQRASVNNNNSNTRERYLIVDIGPTGDTVTSVRSFSSSWQPLGATISKAPTWEAEEVPKTDQAAGLMLRIEGVQSINTPGWPGDGQENVSKDVVPELVELFEKRMAILRKVVEDSEGPAQPMEG